MKKSSFRVHPKLFKILLLLLLLMVLAAVARSSSLPPHHYMPETYNEKGTNVGHQSHTHTKMGGSEEELGIGMELYPTGSSLPDCSHACGSCRPCLRVMVSFKCSTESCPVVYRCMCRGRYYHVPSI